MPAQKECVIVEWTFTCDKCGFERSIQMPAGEYATPLFTAEGWVRDGMGNGTGRWLCPKHAEEAH